MTTLTKRETHLLMLAFGALKGSTIYADEQAEAEALHTKIKTTMAEAGADREMLRGIWSSIWTFDDCEEACISNEVRNELGEHLVSVGAIKAENYAPLPTEEDAE